MTRVISFAGLKGGVGKTSQTLSVAYCAANEFDKKVLVIDLDPQSSTSIILGVTPNNYDARTPNKDMTQLLKEVEMLDLSYEQDYLDDEEPEEDMNLCGNVKGIHTLIEMVIEGKGRSITKEVIPVGAEERIEPISDTNFKRSIFHRHWQSATKNSSFDGIEAIFPT